MRFLTHHMLRDSAGRLPEKEALVHGAERLNYHQAWQACEGLADGLCDAGVVRGERVGILLEPSVPLAVSIFAVSRAGGVFVPIHHALFAEQIEHIIRDCRISAIITSVSRYEALKPLLQSCPSVRFMVLAGGGAPADSALPVHSYEELSSRIPAQPRRDANIEQDLAAILYTSGSTGKPKGVMLSHANVLAGADIVSTYLGITEQERILAVLPFSFDAGLNQLTTSVAKGATCVMMKFLFAKEIVAQLHKERITGLAGVPPLWNIIAQDSSGLAAKPLPNLRYITNTGGALPLRSLECLRAALPDARVFLMYGLTEAFRSTYLPPEELDRRPTSMGKAIPDTEIWVLDENGKICPPGEIGELVHRGPTVSLGYWGLPELTRRVLRPNPLLPPEIDSPERVCYSGDLVQTDEEGFLFFVGRRDNQIKSSGFRISPNEVEAVLCRLDQIREAAVIGVPDEMLGQHIRAFVVAVDGATPDPAQLLGVAATMMPRHMVPKAIEVVSELPKTASGKIDYPGLRRRVEAEANPPS
jgi:acyl-CoA ligase (AMP-forming) (exosortase A-associated)